MRRCTKCHGVGNYMPPHGSTRADIKQCHICKGTGFLPRGYIVKEDTAKNRKKRYFNKNDGIILVRDIEEI